MRESVKLEMKVKQIRVIKERKMVTGRKKRYKRESSCAILIIHKRT